MSDVSVPTGNLQGDSKAMPNQGTGTGVTDTYGADLSPSATNQRGSIHSAAKSDPWKQDMADKTEGS